MDFRTISRLLFEAPPPKDTPAPGIEADSAPDAAMDSSELVPPPPGADDIGETDPDLAFRPSGMSGMPGGPGGSDTGGPPGAMGDPGAMGAPPPQGEPESADADAINAQVENKLTKMCEKAALAFEKDVLRNDERMKLFLSKVQSSGTKEALKDYLKTMYIKDAITDEKERMFATVSVDKFAELMSQKILGKLL